MITICAISDQHSLLPDIPPCDLLLIGGDICPCSFGYGSSSPRSKGLHQAMWLKDEFKPWLERQPVKETVMCWGNHDWIGEHAPEHIPKLPCHILTDKGVELFGLKIYGSPWQLPFFDWAFNAAESELEKRWAAIPDDTDILVLHGPPYGHGDLAPAYPNIRNEMEHVGSKSLTKRIEELPKLKLAIYGHIHPGRGVYQIGNTVCCNVTVVNEKYKMVHKPMMFKLDEKLEVLT
jgi:Icc-related predicted phosphoesterase